jgi:hypothetical protein
MQIYKYRKQWSYIFGYIYITLWIRTNFSKSGNLDTKKKCYIYISCTQVKAKKRPQNKVIRLEKPFAEYPTDKRLFFSGGDLRATR